MINKPQEGYILESGSLQQKPHQNGSILCREINSQKNLNFASLFPITSAHWAPTCHVEIGQ